MPDANLLCFGMGQERLLLRQPVLGRTAMNIARCYTGCAYRSRKPVLIEGVAEDAQVIMMCVPTEGELSATYFPGAGLTMAAKASCCCCDTGLPAFSWYLCDFSILETLPRPQLWQMETALADQAVEKLMRGPTSTTAVV